MQGSSLRGVIEAVSQEVLKIAAKTERRQKKRVARAGRVEIEDDRSGEEASSQPGKSVRRSYVGIEMDLFQWDPGGSGFANLIR